MQTFGVFGMPTETPEFVDPSSHPDVNLSGDSHVISTTQTLQDKSEGKTIEEAGKIAEEQVIRDMTGELFSNLC